MDLLREYIDNGDHGKILSMKEEWAGPYRAIAAIHLEQFELALELVKKKTFEHAYILYRMRRHRHAIHILNGLSGAGADILKAQCLYNIGHYGEAYKCLLSRGHADEFAVNLAAMSSLCELSELGRYRPLAVAPTYKESLPDGKWDPQFKDPECIAEYEYNKLFKHVHDRHKYLKLLGNLDAKFGGKCQPISKQIQLLCDKDVTELSRREQEIVDFNVKKTAAISDPVHYQKNYIANTEENGLIKASLSLSDRSLDAISYKAIKPNSDAARIMKAFLYIKSGVRVIKYDYISRILKDCGDCLEKEVLLLIASDLNSPDKQKLATEILLNSK